MGIEVNPNHGLYAFFRRQEKDGNVSYETVEPADLVTDKSGAFSSVSRAAQRGATFVRCVVVCEWYVCGGG